MAHGKLVDTWYFACPNVTPEHPIDPEDLATTKTPLEKVPVHVRLIKDFEEDGPPQSTRTVRFEVSCRTPEFILEGTDIEALRVAAWHYLRTHYTIKWEPWYLVDLTPEAPYQGLGTGLVFSYKEIEKGIAWEGTALMRERRYRSDMISFWPQEFRSNNGRILACIPATNAHTAALEDFCRCIDELRKRLAGFLTPEQIIHTLTTLKTNPLLPQPSEPSANP